MIYLTGDTHGYMNLYKLNTPEFKNKIKANDYLIILGDFGGLFYGDEYVETPSSFPTFLNPQNLKVINRDELVMNWLKEQPYTILFIDGNHENFALLNNYPIEQWNGGSVHYLAENIIHLMRGQIFTIEGYDFFTMGGAESPDRGELDKNWWPEELPSWNECNQALDKLEEHNWTVDFILTHCLPDNLIPYYYKHNIITNLLFSIDKQTTFKHWYCGHYHINEEKTKKHTILQDKIIDINGNIIWEP